MATDTQVADENARKMFLLCLVGDPPIRII